MSPLVYSPLFLGDILPSSCRLEELSPGCRTFTFHCFLPGYHSHTVQPSCHGYLFNFLSYYTWNERMLACFSRRGAKTVYWVFSKMYNFPPQNTLAKSLGKDNHSPVAAYQEGDVNFVEASSEMNSHLVPQ